MSVPRSAGVRAATAALRLAVAVAGTVAALAAIPVAAEPATFRVDPALTTAQFAVTEWGVIRRRGRFARTAGEIMLDPALAVGRIDFVIDTRSVSTGWSLRDAFVTGGLMLDADAYPAIRFRSTRVAFVALRPVGVDGEITLHGVTRPVRLAIRRLDCATDAAGREGCDADIGLSISRAAFGMTYAYPLVGDAIDIDVALTAVRVGTGAGGPAP
jgi:polyisoprenoid-binding protein YceI